MSITLGPQRRVGRRPTSGQKELGREDSLATRHQVQEHGLVSVPPRWSFIDWRDRQVVTVLGEKPEGMAKMSDPVAEVAPYAQEDGIVVAHGCVPKGAKPVIVHDRRAVHTVLDRDQCRSNQSRGTLRHERVDLEDLTAEPLCHRLDRRQPSKPRANGRLRPLAGPFRRHSLPRGCPEFLQRIDVSTRGTSGLMCPVSRHP